jgi:peptidoglycan/LPS O-acetylase OafA/YrhL
MDVLGLFAAAVLFGGMVASVCVDPRSRIESLLCWRPLRQLGARSYAVYLLHVPIAFVLAPEFIDHGLVPTVLSSQIPGSLMFAATCSALAVGISVVTWALIERPFLSLKRFVPVPITPASATGDRASVRSVPAVELGSP